MRDTGRLLIILVIIAVTVVVAGLWPSPGMAAKSRPAASSGDTATHRGDTDVQGYTRKDGTYVRPHKRTDRNSTKADAYSTSSLKTYSINFMTGTFKAAASRTATSTLRFPR